MLILHDVDETWVLELNYEETIFTQVTLRQIMSQLQSMCGELHAIDVLTLQNEMQYYHTDSEGILEYINALEAAQNTSKRGTVNKLITDATLLLIATNTMFKTGAHPCTTDKWEDLDVSAQTWNTWKTAYKTADMKERVRRLAMGDNAARGSLQQAVTPPTQTPQGTAIDDLVNKDDLKYSFIKLSAAATTEKVVLEQLTSEIATLTSNKPHEKVEKKHGR